MSFKIFRSCTEVDYLNGWTNKYLQFAKTFMKDVASYEHFFENPFLESQVCYLLFNGLTSILGSFYTKTNTSIN